MHSVLRWGETIAVGSALWDPLKLPRRLPASCPLLAYFFLLQLWVYPPQFWFWFHCLPCWYCFFFKYWLCSASRYSQFHLPFLTVYGCSGQTTTVCSLAFFFFSSCWLTSLEWFPCSFYQNTGSAFRGPFVQKTSADSLKHVHISPFLSRPSS